LADRLLRDDQLGELVGDIDVEPSSDDATIYRCAKTAGPDSSVDANAPPSSA